MSKILPYGVPDKHILKSHGADTDILKFYCTQNSSTYGARWPKFEPRMGHAATGSGYTSNVRPVISYSARLDEVDNPAMGLVFLADRTYVTVDFIMVWVVICHLFIVCTDVLWLSFRH